MKQSTTHARPYGTRPECRVRQHPASHQAKLSAFPSAQASLCCRLAPAAQGRPCLPPAPCRQQPVSSAPPSSAPPHSTPQCRACIHLTYAHGARASAQAHGYDGARAKRGGNGETTARHKQQADRERTEGRGDRAGQEHRWGLQGPDRLPHTPYASAPVHTAAPRRPCTSFSGRSPQPAPAREHGRARQAWRQWAAETNWPDGTAR